MVFTCCVPGCRTGHKPRKGEPVLLEKIPLFRFPQNDIMRQKWLRVIPRKGMCLTKSLRVCAKHFYKEDIMSTSSDCHENRKAARMHEELKSLRIKPGATPRIFPSLPKYFTKPPACKNKRSGTALSSSRLTVENKKLSEANKLLLEEDKVEDFNALMEKLRNTTLPSDYITVRKEKVVLFLYVPIPEMHLQPKILASVQVDDALNVTAHVASQRITKREFSHILVNSHLKTVTQLTNVLAHCKSLVDPQRQQIKTSNKMLDTAIESLKSLVSSELEAELVNGCLIQFIIEQLELCQLKLHARRYSLEVFH